MAVGIGGGRAVQRDRFGAIVVGIHDILIGTRIGCRRLIGIHGDHHLVLGLITVIVGDGQGDCVHANRQTGLNDRSRAEHRGAFGPLVSRDGAIGIRRARAIQGHDFSAVAVAVRHGLIRAGIGHRVAAYVDDVIV